MAAKSAGWKCKKSHFCGGFQGGFQDFEEKIRLTITSKASHIFLEDIAASD